MAADEGQTPHGDLYHYNCAIYYSKLLSLSQRCDLVDKICEINREELEAIRAAESINTIIDWMET